MNTNAVCNVLTLREPVASQVLLRSLRVREAARRLDQTPFSFLTST